MSSKPLSLSFRHVLLALSFALLAACGGGGGGGVGNQGALPTPAADPEPVEETDDLPEPDPEPVEGTLVDCLSTFDGECLTNNDFTEKVAELTGRNQNALTNRVENDASDLDNPASGINADSVSWPLEMINVHEALANLELVRGSEAAAAPGEGVTIGFLSSGINPSHHVFGLDVTPRSEEDFSISRGTARDTTNEPVDKYSRGTAIAGVAAGRYGVAYGADVKMFPIEISSGSSDDRTQSNQEYEGLAPEELELVDNSYPELFVRSLRNDLDILNLSWGFLGNIEDYTEQLLRNRLSRMIEILAQSDKEEGKTILVWAAGNAGNFRGLTLSSPQILPGLVARIDELQGHSIAVVSVGEDGTISDFSNRCGIAKDFCIAAPGENILAAHKQEGDKSFYSLGEGTSFSAPMVSGGLAVMKQFFRDQLTNEELVARLFDTAKDDGMYSNSAIYGHGLMDLGAATNPWGIPEFMDTTVSETSGASVTSSVVTLGAPLGDGLTQALSSREIAAFDALGAPFWFEASHFTVPASGASVASRLQRFLNPIQLRSLPDAWQFNLRENVSATEIGHLALTDGASRFTVEAPQGVAATVFQKPQDLEGLTLAWTPTNFDALTIEAGYLNERHSLLGSQAKGAFGHLSGETLFLGAELNTTAGSWQLAAQGELGQVNPSVGQSRLIDAVSSLSTSAFRLQATRPFANGSTLSFSLSQPLRVERGFADFSLPTGRTQDGRVLSRVLSAPLAPSGRQLDLTAKLEFPWLGGDLSMGATSSSQPRHQSKATPEWTVFTGYRSTW